MMRAYSDPRRASDPHALPDIEVFELTAAEIAVMDEDTVADYMRRPEFRLAAMNGRVRERMVDAIVEEEGLTGGYFWWSCFPGCLPDGQPMGPFATADEALADARESCGAMDDDWSSDEEAEVAHERAHAGVSDPDACGRGASCPARHRCPEINDPTASPRDCACGACEGRE
jgi:hypothetical protein